MVNRSISRSYPIEAAIKAAGSITALAKAIGVSDAAIHQWTMVPPLRVLQVEKVTGVPRWVLRPDLYPPTQEDAGRVQA